MSKDHGYFDPTVRIGQFIIYDAFVHVDGPICQPRIYAYHRNLIDPIYTCRWLVWSGSEYRMDERGAEEELERARDFLNALPQQREGPPWLISKPRS